MDTQTTQRHVHRYTDRHAGHTEVDTQQNYTHTHTHTHTHEPTNRHTGRLMKAQASDLKAIFIQSIQLWLSARGGCVTDDITVYFWVTRTASDSHFVLTQSDPSTACSALATLAYISTLFLKHKLALMSFHSQHTSGNMDLGHPNITSHCVRDFMKRTRKIKKKKIKSSLKYIGGNIK